MLKQIRIPGATLSVTDVGSGSALLLVHGFPLDHSMWQSQIDFFKTSHRVIAPDLRGFGKSTGMLNIFSMKTFADDLSALLDELEITEQVTLCGLSMGGYIAFQFALHDSERLKSLILCDTKATADSEIAKQNRHTTADRVLTEGQNFLAEAMPEKLFFSTTFTSKPDIIKSTQMVIQNTSPQAIAAASRGMADRPDVTAQIKQIMVPTLVIVGEEDTITTIEEMQLIANSIPKSEFVIIPQAGHMSPLEQPDTVNRTISKFLEGE